MDNEQVIAKKYMADINWAELEKELSKKLNTNIVITPFIKSGQMGSYIKFSSQDIVEHSGVMKNVFTKLQVESFSVSSQYDIEKSGEYWCSIHFGYETTRGSNGNDLVNGWFNFEKKTWTFRYTK